MISDIQSVEKRANPFAKQILIFGTTGVVLILLIYVTPLLSPLQIPAAFLLPVYLTYMIFLAIFLYRTINSSLPIIPFLIGFLFVACGTAFDGISTLLMSPTLTLEANPVARSLLDSGFSVNFVIIYGIASQAAYVIFVSVLWAAFLKHKDVLITLTKSRNEKSILGFIKAATGGAHLSWRQYLLPLSLGELPASYYIVWIVSVCFVGGNFYRWYLGFNWLGLLSLPLVLVISISMAIPSVGYVIWLWMEFKNT